MLHLAAREIQQTLPRIVVRHTGGATHDHLTDFRHRIAR